MWAMKSSFTVTPLVKSTIITVQQLHPMNAVQLLYNDVLQDSEPFSLKHPVNLRGVWSSPRAGIWKARGLQCISMCNQQRMPLLLPRCIDSIAWITVRSMSMENSFKTVLKFRVPAISTKVTSSCAHLMTPLPPCQSAAGFQHRANSSSYQWLGHCLHGDFWTRNLDLSLNEMISDLLQLASSCALDTIQVTNNDYGGRAQHWKGHLDHNAALESHRQIHKGSAVPSE